MDFYYNFLEKYLGGHLTIGKMTVHGLNAMHWGVTYHTKKYGYISFRLPFTCWGKWIPLYFYISPDGTPQSSTLYIGNDLEEKKLSKLRYKYLGHGYKSNEYNYNIVYAINNGDINIINILERNLKLKEMEKFIL
jgi:hypothetical protein